jgi:hypothetical protein
MATRHPESAPESAYVAEERIDIRMLDDVATELIDRGIDWTEG